MAVVDLPSVGYYTGNLDAQLVRRVEPHTPYRTGSYAAEVKDVDRHLGEFFAFLRGPWPLGNGDHQHPLRSVNPSYFARKELQQYLAKLAEPDAELRDRVAALRRRPRRSGKPL